MSEMDQLPADAINIGGDHWLVHTEYQGEPAGVNEYHRRPDGRLCAGWLAFKGFAWERSFKQGITSWDVISLDPLTLSPSILCRACGSHGFIRGGKWVAA